MLCLRAMIGSAVGTHDRHPDLWHKAVIFAGQQENSHGPVPLQQLPPHQPDQQRTATYTLQTAPVHNPDVSEQTAAAENQQPGQTSVLPVEAAKTEQATGTPSRHTSLATQPPSALWTPPGSPNPTPTIPNTTHHTSMLPVTSQQEGSSDEQYQPAAYHAADDIRQEQQASEPDSAAEMHNPVTPAASAVEAQPGAQPHDGSSDRQQTGLQPQQQPVSHNDAESAISAVHEEAGQEVQRETLAAGQQLARDHSLALRDVRQAMQAESDRRNAQAEEEAQGEASWRSIQEVEREALAAGQQLAQDNSQALQEVRQSMQGSALPMCATWCQVQIAGLTCYIPAKVPMYLFCCMRAHNSTVCRPLRSQCVPVIMLLYII